MKDFKLKDLLDITTLSKEDILLICNSAGYFKEVFTRSIKKVPVLRGKTVVTLFFEPSTRTRISFELAAKRLSADTINVAAKTSSVVKGESLIDTVNTLEAMNADFIVMRHPVSMAPHFLARHSKAAVINGGDGYHAHPTQALLDAYSIIEKKESLEGLHIGIVGDIKHSRVARSDVEIFQKLGAKVTLIAPPTLLPDNFKTYGCDLSYDLDKVLPDLDVVNMLRIQRERQKNSHFPSIREYSKFFSLTKNRLKSCKNDIIVMHPGPMNRGIEIDDYVADCDNAIINEQVTNGIAVRMSVFYLLSGGKNLDGAGEEE